MAQTRTTLETHRSGRAKTRAIASVACGLALLGLAATASADPSKLPTPFGFNYGEVETTRIAALGGALRAVGTGTSGMFLNPASLAATRMYHIEALLDASPEVGRAMGGGAIVDSMMNRYHLAGGISAVYGILDPSGADWTTLDVRVALAYPITDRIFIGLGGRYAGMSQGSEVSVPAVAGEGDVSTLKLDAFTMDVGVIVKPTDSFFVGLLGQNVASTHHGSLPTTIGGGVGFGTSDFSLEVDGVADLNSYASTTARVMAGGELLVADHVPIRLGYRFDQGPKLHAISAGLGYVGTEFSIEGSVRRTLSDPGATSIFVGVAYFLESSSLLRGASPNIGFE